VQSATEDRIFESVGGFYYHMANRVCDRYCLECSKQNKARKKIRSFTREQMLSYHMQDKDCKESICERCGRSFNVKQMLESHVKKKVCKKIPAQESICRFCNKSFKNKQMLDSHVQNRVCEESQYFYTVLEYEERFLTPTEC